MLVTVAVVGEVAGDQDRVDVAFFHELRSAQKP